MVFTFLKRNIALYSADRIAKAASSQEAFDGGAATAFSVPEIIELYFQLYGSTERKFDFYKKPGFYIGYVRVPNKDEFLSVVLLQPNGSVAASFYPEMEYGQDFLGLMAKKSFADDVASSFVQAAGRHRSPASPVRLKEMTKTFCNSCGRQVAYDARFCYACGASQSGVAR